jgi:transportin-3
MDDYVHCFMAYLTHLPEITLSIPSLSFAVSHTISALSCPGSETILISLDVLAHLANIVNPAGPESNNGTAVAPAARRPFSSSTPSTPASPAAAALVAQIISIQFSERIMAQTLKGIVQGYPEDALEQVTRVIETIFLARLSAAGPAGGEELKATVGKVMLEIPNQTVPQSDREAFYSEVQE